MSATAGPPPRAAAPPEAALVSVRCVRVSVRCVRVCVRDWVACFAVLTLTRFAAELVFGFDGPENGAGVIDAPIFRIGRLLGTLRYILTVLKSFTIW